MNRLFQLLHRVPHVIHWYLEEIVFPTFMEHQRLKLALHFDDALAPLVAGLPCLPGHLHLTDVSQLLYLTFRVFHPYGVVER